LTARVVWFFTLICSAGFVASTWMFLGATPPNPWPLYLSIPVLIFVCAYSFTKRFTALSHFWLGASLLLAPVAAWIAIWGMEADFTVPFILGLAVLFWVAGFDIIYACQDVEYDRQAKLASIPARLGVSNSLRIALICHVIMLGLLLEFYWVADLGAIYLIGLSSVAALLAYEHWLVKPDDLGRVNRAFFHVNAVISVGLFVVVVLQLAVK
jgi:4-hydroxybenzoate polyprenyltransferase